MKKIGPLKIVLALLGLGLLLASTAVAQTEKPSTPTASAQTKPAAKEDYAAMVTRLKTGDLNVDFGALRQAYTETKDFSGYGDSGKGALFAALNSKDYKQALSLAEKRLAEVYVDLNGHFVATVANRELGNADRSDFHRQIFLGLIQSILQGHDGQTMPTAYSVISIDEEHVVLNYLGFIWSGTQALNHDQGHSYDVMSVTDPKTKKDSVIYFNIDRFYGKF